MFGPSGSVRGHIPGHRAGTSSRGGREPGGGTGGGGRVADEDAGRSVGVDDSEGAAEVSPGSSDQLMCFSFPHKGSWCRKQKQAGNRQQ